MTDVSSRSPATEGLEWASLGGNNESAIGGNCHAYSVSRRQGNKTVRDVILVDMGSLFSDRKVTGFDTLFPKVDEFFTEHAGDFCRAEDKAQAIVLTHAHQDHIGAISHYINMGYKLPPIYGSPLSLSILRSDLLQHKIDKAQWPQMHSMRPGEIVKIGGFTIEPVTMSHSLSNGYSLAIEGNGTRVLHSGDVKADQTVLIGPKTDFDHLKRVGAKGVDAMLLDSTRVSDPRPMATEEDIRNSLTAIMNENRGKRMIFAVMGANMERIAGLLKIARDNNKTVVVAGSAIARNLLSLKFAGIDLNKVLGGPVKILEAKSPEAKALNPADTIVLATGTQGEENAAIARASRSEHPHFAFNPGNDVLVMTSSVIPGNEAEAEAPLAAVRALGVPVITNKDRLTHASGHGHQPDMEAIVKAVNPKVLIPKHGDAGLLAAHEKFMQSIGFKTMHVDNWEKLRITKNGVTRESAAASRWFGVRDDAPAGQPWAKKYVYGEYKPGEPAKAPGAKPGLINPKP